MECGGKGGCDGATAELALDYLAANGGITQDKAYQYTSFSGEDGVCLDKEVDKSPIVKIGGYKSVPTNNLIATMYALSQGPLVVAVAASSWMMYGGGIFDTCKKNAILNHAVTMVGYGLQGGKGYWLIRNSWGSAWG